MNTEKKKRTDYSKTSYKGETTGIRFHREHEAAAFKMSGLKTRQQLVDFLLENYVKGSNPVMERQQMPQYQQQPKSPMPTQQQIDPLLKFKERLDVITSKLGLDCLFADAKKEGVDWRGKQELEGYWKQSKKRRGLEYNDENN